MRINTIDALKKNINISTFLIFLVIFTISISCMYLTFRHARQEQILSDNQQIAASIDIYKSNLSEKLSIIASSNLFIDYLRSGYLTRNHLYLQFLSQIVSLKEPSISGMQILDKEGNQVFTYGESSPLQVTLKLCYLDQTLDPSMGECYFLWRLYFKKSELIQEIALIDRNVRSCSTCNFIPFINNTYFGSFPIQNNSDIYLALTIYKKNNYLFYIYLSVIIFSLVLFGIWSWYRLNSLLNYYIADPIRKLTHRLKNNHPLNTTNYLDEIEYLIQEINTWKLRSNKLSLDKNKRKLADIAAQLAHDVRSPLSVIDMVMQDIDNVPEESRSLLRNATQRISDIANNFLNQYKKPQFYLNTSLLTNEHILNLLDRVIAEKKRQFAHLDINIKLVTDENSYDIFSLINKSDFTRALSNLINNAIEATTYQGKLQIFLRKNNQMLQLDIIDNGCGISSELASTIISGKTATIGKKNGHGLGLSHALFKITEWQGALHISSPITKGTCISIKLPVSLTKPSWFYSHVTCAINEKICILDDEPYAHQIWKDRLLEHSSVLEIYHCYTLSDFKQLFEMHKKSKTLYFIDYHLKNYNGIDDIIKMFNINSATLVTNQYDDETLQKRCDSLGIKILPKNLIPYIPIVLQNGLLSSSYSYKQ